MEVEGQHITFFYVIHELEILKEDKLPISLSVDMVL